MAVYSRENDTLISSFSMIIEKWKVEDSTFIIFNDTTVIFVQRVNASQQLIPFVLFQRSLKNDLQKMISGFQTQRHVF